jgi:hypothetical protein
VVTVGGKRMQISVVEGMSLYPGSSWAVENIGLSRGKSGYEYDLKIKDASGNTKTISTTMAGGLSEEESNVLGRMFTQNLGLRDTIYYKTDEKVIEKTTVNNLKVLFARWGVDIDLSEVSGDTGNTNRVVISDGMTLKDVLIAVLPSGYYYSIGDGSSIVIKRYEESDPCGKAVIYSPEALKDLVVEEYKHSNDMKLNMLCSAKTEFKDIIANYDDEVMPDTGDNVVDAAKWQLALTYQKIAELDSLDAGEKNYCRMIALGYYKELYSSQSSVGDVTRMQTEISNLQMEIYGETTVGSVSVEDNGQNAYVELVSVVQNDKDSKSSAVISKDGASAQYYVGESLFAKSLTDQKYGEYNWVVSKIGDDSVQLKKVYASGARSSTTEVIEVDGSEVIEGYVMKVKSIDSKKEAYLTITPGSGEALHSVSNFTVRIPIEKRAIQLNPEQIDDRIEWAKNTQEKLEKITSKLETIVKDWNYACLAVFGAVWLKNGIFAGGKNQVRSDVIHGVNGESGWSKYCEDEVSAGRYSNYDSCMQGNAEKINNDMDTAVKAKDYVQSLGGKYADEEWYQDLEEGYGGSLDMCKELLGSRVSLDDDSLENYAYMYTLKENGVSDVMEKSLSKSFTPMSDYVGSDNAELKANIDGCKNVSLAVNNNEDKWRDKSDEERLDVQKQIAAGVYESSYMMSMSGQGNGVEVPVSKYVPSLSNDYLQNYKVQLVGKVFQGKTSADFLVYTTSGSVSVKELAYDDYLTILKSERAALDPSNSGKTSDSSKQVALDKINADITKIEGVPGGKTGYSSKELAETVTANSGAHYYVSGKTIYVGQPAYSSGSLNENYDANAKLEVYSSGEYKGLPYCLPYDDGNFIKLLSYAKNNEIDEMQFWNVGPDGLLCTGDDVLIEHQSELRYADANPSYNKLKLFANRYVRMTFVEKEKIEINGNYFTVSYGRSRVEMEGTTGSCYDVMSPNDCKLLFNTCDPVLCPPSRFNLGGRWKVDSVIDSGLVGSLILGQGNGDVVPVCLSGVLSSLNYYGSLLDGYVECLEAAKYEGKTVGICDTLRQVYVCEIMTREVAAIVDANGGLLDFIAEKVYNNKDQSGGEYLNFKSNMKNMQDSISYFTTDYGATMFAAFQGRSTEEIGATICKQAIYGQAPWFGDLLDQVTTPEDPNQFYASLKVMPYAPSQGLASYSTYYHIYAGNNENIPNVVYQVYLKNSLTNEKFYTTEECNGVSSSIELTDSADYTVDCIAPEGLDTVCVVLNGEEHCGFGSVTTSYSMNAIKDEIIADEAMRNITTEEDCYPSASVASPTVSSLATLGTTDSLVLPYTYGQLSSGIQRVCALENPGTGQGNSGDWVVVGTCGKDEEGRSLGTCWVNTDSVDLRSAENVEGVNDYWEQTEYANKVSQSGVEMLDDEKSKEAYNKYVEGLKAGDCSVYRNYASLFEDIYEASSSYSYSAAAQYRIGEIFYKIGAGEVCGFEGEKGVSYDATLDGVSLGSKSEIVVGTGRAMFSVVFEGLHDDYEISYSSSDEKLNVICTPISGGKSGCGCNIDLEENDVLEVSFNIRSGYSQKFRFVGEKAATSLTSVAVSCESVCDGIFNPCDENECLSASKGCYFTEGVIDKCESCSSLTGEGDELCKKFSTQDTCENYVCYNDAFNGRGKCVWDDAKACVYVSTSEEVSEDMEEGMTDDVVEIAQLELAYWNGADECDSRMTDKIADYYAAGGCPGSNCRDIPWSGAFISYVMEQAGISFPSSCSHFKYFTKLRDDSGERYDCNTMEMKRKDFITAGNLICKCRENSCPISYNDEYNFQESHCDVVIEKNEDGSLTVIGGNVGNTVARSVISPADLKDDSYYGFVQCNRR